MKIKVFATLFDTASVHEDVAKAVRLGGGVIEEMKTYPKDRVSIFTIDNMDEEEFADVIKGEGVCYDVINLVA